MNNVTVPLDGKDTFHKMGIIAASSIAAPISSFNSPAVIRIRREKLKRVTEITESRKIPIEHYYQEGRKALSSIEFKTL